MNRTATITVLLFFAALALAGCEPGKPPCSAQITDVGRYMNFCGLHVPQGAAAAEITVHAKLTHGGMTWELEDPTGAVVWTESAGTDAPVSSSARFENPLPGRWNMRFRLEQAAGEYQVPWTVK